MSHISHDKLNKRLLEAAKLVQLGAIHKHYKYPDRDYKVLGFAIQEATQKVAVRYKDIKSDIAPEFVRDLDSWLETVTWEGNVVPRFSPLES